MTSFFADPDDFAKWPGDRVPLTSVLLSRRSIIKQHPKEFTVELWRE
jgi:hypothetical protein